MFGRNVMLFNIKESKPLIRKLVWTWVLLCAFKPPTSHQELWPFVKYSPQKHPIIKFFLFSMHSTSQNLIMNFGPFFTECIQYVTVWWGSLTIFLYSTRHHLIINFGPSLCNQPATISSWTLTLVYVSSSLTSWIHFDALHYKVQEFDNATKLLFSIILIHNN